MKNLAGDKDCDAVIKDELVRARINVVKLESPQRGEVAASIVGKLGRFTFKRAWYYWSVEGSMPINVARILLDDPEGKASVRIDGHCEQRSHEYLDKKAKNGRPFVYSYDIDDQAGLRLFADTIRQFDLMNEVVDENG